MPIYKIFSLDLGFGCLQKNNIIEKLYLSHVLKFLNAHCTGFFIWQKGLQFWKIPKNGFGMVLDYLAMSRSNSLYGPTTPPLPKNNILFTLNKNFCLGLQKQGGETFYSIYIIEFQVNALFVDLVQTINNSLFSSPLIPISYTLWS